MIDVQLMHTIPSTFTVSFNFKTSIGRDKFYVSTVCCNHYGRWFLPRCMKCRRGLAMRILSICLSVCPSFRLSVCLSHAWSLTKWKKDRSRFLYHTKEHLV